MYGTLDIRGPSAGEDARYLLTQASTSLGRDRRNDICLDDPAVSRFHARVTVSDGSRRIVDLGSANGTRVDGEELEARVEYELRDGARIEIGPFTVMISTAPTPAGASVQSPRLVVPGGPVSRLVVTTPEGTVQHQLRGTDVTIGRDPSNDVVVDADTVSRRHAVLVRRAEGWEIADLGSANGLWRDGQPVERLMLSDGDVLTIGRSVRLEFREAPEAARSEAPTMELDLPRRGSLILGRGDDADVVISHPQVSKAHARVIQGESGLIVEDLGSSSGTYVNGLPVKQSALKEGDILRVGSSRLMLAQGRLQVIDEEGNLRIDAFHLSRQVGKGLRILEDVSLSIFPREFVAIVGGSGSGKTTLLNALCGFHPATSGAVLLNGVNLYSSFSAYRNDLGYVPQDDIIHRELPVMRALNYAAELRMPRDTTPYERRQRVQEVLQQLDIHSCWDRPVRQLSGGQRKRVSMGVELLTRPSLFFLDEATSGLDPGTETQMMRLLRRLADEGRTVVLVTHATKNVMICDKVVFLARGGHLAYFGRPAEALQYFGVGDFDEIYTRLEEEEGRAWGRRYRSSQPYRENVQARLDEVAAHAASTVGSSLADAPSGAVAPDGAVIRPALAVGAPPGSAAAGAAPAPAHGQPPQRAAPASGARAARPVSGLRQFSILSRRQLDTIWGDKRTAAMLLAIAPFLGALDFLIWRRDMFDPRTGSASQAVMMFFITAIITILIGTITSVREIVKEDAIYRRERMVGLRVLPFVGSKAAVGFLFALYSAVMLFVFMIAAVDLSHLSGAETLALLVPMVLGTFAGVMWGLLVSALAPTEDRAMLLVIVVLVPQFVFSGGIIPIKDIGFAGTILGWLTSARWELGAVVTSAKVAGGSGLGPGLGDISLPGMQGLPTLAEQQNLASSLQNQYGDIFSVDVGFYWLMALVLSLGLFVVVLLLQKRKDRV